MRAHALLDWLDKMRLERCNHCGGTGKCLDAKAVGWALREMREKQKLSAREIARRLNLSVPYVSDLELGRRGWNAERVMRYLKACGLWEEK